jgi:hypothetical protein
VTGIFISRLSFYGRSGAFPDPGDLALVGESLWLRDYRAICVPWRGRRNASKSEGFLDKRRHTAQETGLVPAYREHAPALTPSGKTKTIAWQLSPPGVTRHIETAYIAMCARQQARLAPDHIVMPIA